MDYAQKKAEALEAARLLSSPFLNKVFDELEEFYTNSWKKIDDSKMREELWYQQNGLQKFRKSLNEYLVIAQRLSKGKDEEIEAAVRSARRK